MVAKTTLAILIALCTAAGARELQQAPSPAPTILPIADMAFILSADEVLPETIPKRLLDVRERVKEHGSSRLFLCRRSSPMLVTLRCIPPARVHSTTAPVRSHLIHCHSFEVLITYLRSSSPAKEKSTYAWACIPNFTEHSQR